MTLSLRLLSSRWLLTAWIPFYGARPLKTSFSVVVDQVANLIIAGELHEGDTVRAGY